MTTPLLEALDGATGWNLTPPQRQAISNTEARMLALELGYQHHAKELAICKQAIQRQRHMICQLLAMFNELKGEMSELSHDLQWHHHDDEIQEIKESHSELMKSQAKQLKTITDRLDALESPKTTTRKTRKTK